jgi:ABC-type glycerol-3-phosphate transport system permease component
MKHPRRLAVHITLSGVCLLLLFPIGYTLYTSLQPRGFGLATNAFGDGGLFFGHYRHLLTSPRFGRSILNSTVNSLGGAVVTTSICAMAGYAFARMHFAGRQIILGGLLAMMLLPTITTLVPLFAIASDLSLLNTYTVMILVYGAYGVPFGVWVMKGFYESLPPSLEEAAAVDGANALQILLWIVVPLSAPGLAAVFLVNFVYNWNDFLTALILLTSNTMKTAPVALYDLQSQLEGNNNEQLAAASIIVMTPGLIVFILARRYLMRGMVGRAGL